MKTVTLEVATLKDVKRRVQERFYFTVRAHHLFSIYFRRRGSRKLRSPSRGKG